MSLTFEQWLTLLTLVGAGAGAGWAVFAKVILPAKLRQMERRLEAEITDRASEREYHQKQESLNHAYQISEGAATHQIMAELVGNSNEELAEANRYIREDVKQILARIEARTLTLTQIQVDVAKLKYDYRNLATKLQIMTDLISEVYQDHRNQMRPTDGINEPD